MKKQNIGPTIAVVIILALIAWAIYVAVTTQSMVGGM